MPYDVRGAPAPALPNKCKPCSSASAGTIATHSNRSAATEEQAFGQCDRTPDSHRVLAAEGAVICRDAVGGIHGQDARDARHRHGHGHTFRVAVDILSQHHRVRRRGQSQSCRRVRREVTARIACYDLARTCLRRAAGTRGNAWRGVGVGRGAEHHLIVSSRRRIGTDGRRVRKGCP